MRISNKSFNYKLVIIKSFLVAFIKEKSAFLGITTKPKTRILYKLVRPEVSTKPHLKKEIHEFLINLPQWRPQTSRKGGEWPLVLKGLSLES
jgi:hypothetical protein